MCIQNDVPEMVPIPSGEFLMGAVNDDDMGFTGAFLEEKPQHMVDLEAYTIDTHLVSVERYHRFIQAVDYRPESWQDNWLNAPLQPVRSISLSDVLEYCDWAGKGCPQRLNGRRQPEEGWSTCRIRGVTMHLMDRKRQIERKKKARQTSACFHQTGMVFTTWLAPCSNGAEMTGDSIPMTADTIP